MASQDVAINRYVINNDDIYSKPRSGPRTFAEAAASYVASGGDGRYLPPLVARLGPVPLSELAPFDIRQLAEQLYPDRKGATKNRCALTPARAVINHAYDRGWCGLMRIKRFKEEKPVRRGYATPVWLHLFLRQCQTDNLPHLAALVLFMAQTAARVSEAIRVCWGHVNLANRQVLLERTKTEQNAIRSLTDELVARFTELQYRFQPKPEDRVFRFTNRHSVSERIKAVCRRAEIEYKPPHTCGRTTFANMAMDLGMDVKTAMAAGGWVSSPIFLDTYVRTRKNAGRIVADRFNQLSFTDTV